MRSNEEWIMVLNGPDQEDAINDLRAILVRGMKSALSGRYKIELTRIESFVQSALVKILASLHTFTGKSRFVTWAHKIALRVTLTELRGEQLGFSA